MLKAEGIVRPVEAKDWIAAVLVHAKDEAARAFYLRCAEFIAYPQDSRTLYLPIETVIAAYN